MASVAGAFTAAQNAILKGKDFEHRIQVVFSGEVSWITFAIV
jgi:hypothetical protein